MVLGGLSIVLLGCAAVLGTAVLLGKPVQNALLIITLAGGVVSVLTHFLMLLRLWFSR
jgi:hypothetical protein